jgi:hypothetical protein
METMEEKWKESLHKKCEFPCRQRNLEVKDESINNRREEEE